MRFRRQRDSGRSICEMFENLSKRGIDCELYPGLADDQISELESNLEQSLPDDVVEYLRFSNGADLFSRSVSLFGVHIGDPPYRVGDILKATARHISRSSLPPYGVVFGQRLDGSLIIYQQREDSVLFGIWDPESCDWSRQTRSLANWLESEIQFWFEALSDELENS